MSAGFGLRELDDLFQQVIALPPDGRPEFIDSACGGRPALHAALRRMLDAHANAGEFLDNSLPECLGAARSGTRMGRWKLIEPIGEGGLGVVYRASCEADGVTLHAAVSLAVTVRTLRFRARARRGRSTVSHEFPQKPQASESGAQHRPGQCRTPKKQGPLVSVFLFGKAMCMRVAAGAGICEPDQ